MLYHRALTTLTFDPWLIKTTKFVSLLPFLRYGGRDRSVGLVFGLNVYRQTYPNLIM